MSTVASALVCHKVSAHYQFTNGTCFTTSALVLKFSAFFVIVWYKKYIRRKMAVQTLKNSSLLLTVQKFEEFFMPLEFSVKSTLAKSKHKNIDFYNFHVFRDCET